MMTMMKIRNKGWAKKKDEKGENDERETMEKGRKLTIDK